MIRAYCLLVFFFLSLPQYGIAQPGEWFLPPHPGMPQKQRKDVALNIFVAASTYEMLGQPEAALSAYRAAILYDGDPAIHLIAAYCALAAEMHEDAAMHLTAVLQHGRENIIAVRLLAEIHFNAGRYDSAAILLRHLIAKDSSDIETMVILAELLEETHSDEALLLYKKIMENEPTTETAYKLVRLYLIRGAPDSAHAVLEILRKEERETDVFLQNSALIAIQRNDWSTAVQLYRKLLLRHPKEPAYELQLAETLLGADEWVEAATLMKHALTRPDVGQSDKVEIGRIFFQHAIENREDSDEAIDVLRSIMDDYPDDWQPGWFRGIIEYNRGDFENAVKSFTAVLKLIPGNTDVTNILARTFTVLGRYHEAKEAIVALINKEAGNAESWLLLGYAESECGRTEDAKAALEHAGQLDPSNIEIVLALAMLYDETDKAEQSDPLYERAIQSYTMAGKAKDDIYYLLLNNWAYSLAQRDVHLDKAFTMSGLACAYEPDNSSYLDTHAWVLHRLGRHTEALDFALAAVETSQDSAVLFEHLGDILQALGRYTEARQAWMQSLDLIPDNERIHNLLQQHPADHGQ